jgi:hypothetical protein
VRGGPDCSSRFQRWPQRWPDPSNLSNSILAEQVDLLESVEIEVPGFGGTEMGSLNATLRSVLLEEPMHWYTSRIGTQAVS